MKNMNTDEKVSKKELARKFRHEAYLRAKEFRRTDPRQISLKAARKEFQREAYRNAKERNKVYRDAIKNASDERAGKIRLRTRLRRDAKKAVRQNKLKAMVVRGSDIKRAEKG
jgi:hypothetical protein